MDQDATELEHAVEVGVRNVLRSMLGTVFWTILSMLAILVGCSAILFGINVPTVPATLALVAIGLFVVGCSAYLLYDLYRPGRA